jgi:hypothetical protein
MTGWIDTCGAFGEVACESALPVRAQAGRWRSIMGQTREERLEPDRLPRLIRSTWYIVSRRVEGHRNSRYCGRGRLHHSYYFALEPKPNSVALIPIFQLYAYALTVFWVELSIEESPGRRDVPDKGDIFTPRRAVRNPRWKPDECSRRPARWCFA